MLRKALLLAALSTIASAAVTLSSACSGDESRARDAGGGSGRVNGLTREQAAQTLVKVGSDVITVGDFAERLAEQSPYLRARYNSPERRREFLDNMVRFELLAAEAHRRGYDRLPEVDRTRKQMMIQQMMKDEFEDRIKLTDITDDEIRRYYEAHPEEFNKPEQVRASHILIRDRAQAQRVLTQILARRDDVNFFRQMAEQHNQDELTRDRFGDLRFFSRPNERQPGEPEVPPAVAEAAFSIAQIGGVFPELVQADDGFHILKLTGKRAALRRTLDDARRPIQNRLWREKREHAVEEFVNRLRREANVQESFGALSDVHVDVPENTPLVDPDQAHAIDRDEAIEEAHRQVPRPEVPRPRFEKTLPQTREAAP